MSRARRLHRGISDGTTVCGLESPVAQSILDAISPARPHLACLPRAFVLFDAGQFSNRRAQSLARELSELPEGHVRLCVPCWRPE